MSKTKAVVFTIILIAVLSACWILFEKLARESLNNISQWPTVSGTIISSESADDESMKWSVKFAYEVQGVSYKAAQAWGATKEERGKCTAGAAVNVYYNQTRPDKALINLRGYIGLWGYLMIAVPVLFIVGVLIIWIWTTESKIVVLEQR